MTAFRPEILHSLPEFKQFFRGDEELDAIRGRAGSPRPVLLGGVWQITWLILSTPLKFLTSLFLTLIAPLARVLGASDLAIQMEVLGGQLLSELLPLIAYVEEGENYLAPLFNVYAFSASSVYLAPPIQAASLQETPEIYETVEGFDSVHFYQKGVCRGMSNWFAYLYLQTQNDFDDPETHLCAVASSFFSGASSQAALLQALYFPETLLGLKVIPGNEIPYRQNSIDEAFQNAEPGVYFVEVPYHRLLLFKTGDADYLANPSEGVVRLRDPAWRHLKKYEAVHYPHNFLTLSKISID